MGQEVSTTVKQLAQQFNQEKEQNKQQIRPIANLNDLVANQDINGIYNVLSNAPRKDVLSQYQEMTSEQVDAFKTFVKAKKVELDSAATTDNNVKDKQMLFQEAIKESSTPIYEKKYGFSMYNVSRAMEETDSTKLKDIIPRIKKEELLMAYAKMSEENIKKFDIKRNNAEGLDTINVPRLAKYIEKDDMDSVDKVLNTATDAQVKTALGKLSTAQLSKMQLEMEASIKGLESSVMYDYGWKRGESPAEKIHCFKKVIEHIKEIDPSKKHSYNIELNNNSNDEIGQLKSSVSPNMTEKNQSGRSYV